MRYALFLFKDRYLRDPKGTVPIEYGLIGAGIAVAIAATVFLIGDDVQALYDSVLEVFS